MRVLIAEDDLTTRTILVGLLSKWGYDVTAVDDGIKAWDILSKDDAPTLALVDWVMPGMDGVDVIRKVRELHIENPPYVILLSSRDSKDDIVSGLETGANDYIKKPFDKDELVARIRSGKRMMDLQTRLLETQDTLEHLATHDALTGILNRRAILDQLGRELSRAKRGIQSGPVQSPTIGYIDLDQFKEINDVFGHQAGDDVLLRVTETITHSLRQYDSFGRLGGDEFLVIVPNVDVETRKVIFARLLKEVGNILVPSANGDVHITLSIGVATASPEDSLDHLLAIADGALYDAKDTGRNRLCYAN